MTDFILGRWQGVFKQSNFFKKGFLTLTRALRLMAIILIEIGFSSAINVAQADVKYYLNDNDCLTATPYSYSNSQIAFNLYGYEAFSEWRIELADNQEGDIYQFSIWAYALESRFRV